MLRVGMFGDIGVEQIDCKAVSVDMIGQKNPTMYEVGADITIVCSIENAAEMLTNPGIIKGKLPENEYRWFEVESIRDISNGQCRVDLKGFL